MPCGGIYPGGLTERKHPCFHCDKLGCDLWCEEWDAPLHSECVQEFLKGPEGQVVIDHGHGVWMHGTDGTLLCLNEEKPFVA